MDEMEQEKFIADTVVNILKTPGWQVIEKWLNDQISMLQSRAEPAGLDNVRVDLLSYGKDKKNEVKVTVVSIDKDSARHTAKAYQLFLHKIKEWKEISEVK